MWGSRTIPIQEPKCSRTIPIQGSRTIPIQGCEVVVVRLHFKQMLNIRVGIKWTDTKMTNVLRFALKKFVLPVVYGNELYPTPQGNSTGLKKK